MDKTVWACFGLAFFLIGNAAAETVVLQGSTTFEAQILTPHKRLIEVASGHELQVIANKTTPGLLALLEGKADLAMISTPLEAAVRLARKDYPERPYEQLRSFLISQTRVAFGVHPSNPLRSISLDALRKVLAGQIENWSELGGADLPIRLVMVRDGGGVKLTVENEMLAGEPIKAKDPILVPNGPRIIRVVEQEPAALGLTQYNLVERFKLPELIPNRVVVQQLSLVTLGEPNPAAKAVIEAARNVMNPGSEQ